MQNITRHLLCIAVLIGFPSAPIPAAAQQSAGRFDAHRLESFFDDYLAKQMTAHHVAGAVVAVVERDRALFTKGYGYADVARKLPVDPRTTLFLLGSLTKVFTWTAVMQLVEQGKLDLDADVGTYLDFPIPATYPQPITLRHLMSHTGGFEDVKFGQMSAKPALAIPLGQWLASHVPARISPPGQATAYANYGAALAGYIVERVSGMSFDAYLEKSVLDPLQMGHTCSRQPLPAALAANLSQCYTFAGGELQPQPAVAEAVLHPAPAGAVKSSGADMARFMMAHLNGGQLGEAHFLQPSTVQRMQRRSFSNEPRVNGLAHGFWELDANGQRIIGHAGSHFIFNSVLLLFPDQGLGVFLATNSAGGGNFIGESYFLFLEDFVQQTFPSSLPRLAPPADFAERAGRFTGSYRMAMGRVETTPEKLFSLMAVGVSATQDGLMVALPSGKKRFVEVEPLLFRQADGDARIAFGEDATGQITRVAYSLAPLTALIKDRWFESPALHLPLLAFSQLLFLSVLITAPVAFLRRKRAGGARPASLARAAGLAAVLTSLTGIAVLVTAARSLFDVLGLYLGDLPMWRFVRPASIAVAVLAAAMIVLTALSWKRRSESLARRIHLTLLTLAAVGLVWFLSFWNLLGKPL